MAYRFARFIARLPVILLARVEAHGLEYVPTSGAYIAVSNHLGRLDPALVFYMIDRKDAMLMIAEKYRKYAINRWFVKQLNCIWIDRYSGDLVAVRAALNWLKQGGALALAPEGTRSRTGALIRAHSGPSYLAAKSGVPVVPVGITGTEDKVVAARLKRLRRVHVTLRVGKPFKLPPVKGGDREEILQSYTDEIMCRIAALLPPAYHGVYAGHPRIQELQEAARTSWVTQNEIASDDAAS